MTSAMSEPLDTDMLDVDIATLKRLKIMAIENYNKAMKDGSHYTTAFWDGACRMAEWIYEAHGQ